MPFLGAGPAASLKYTIPGAMLKSKYFQAFPSIAVLIGIMGLRKGADPWPSSSRLLVFFREHLADASDYM
jgi:hypothetical protein